MTLPGHRRLILTRHAKSEWDDTSLSDHERPLNARGQRAARALGDWLASRGYEPEEVICSTATRTRQTWDGVASAALGVLPVLRFEDGLYDSTPNGMAALLRTASGPTVMMIGHNPAIAALAARLPASPPLNPDFRRYPTAATLVVDFQIDDWAKLQDGQGSVMDFRSGRD